MKSAELLDLREEQIRHAKRLTAAVKRIFELTPDNARDGDIHEVTRAVTALLENDRRLFLLIAQLSATRFEMDENTETR